MRRSVDFALFVALLVFARLGFCHENAFILYSSLDCSSKGKEVPFTPTQKQLHKTCVRDFNLTDTFSLRYVQHGRGCYVSVFSDIYCSENRRDVYPGGCIDYSSLTQSLTINSMVISTCDKPLPLTASFVPTLRPAASSSASTSSPTHHHSSSDANVLGSAIGVSVGVVAIAAVIGAFLWLRKKRNRGGGDKVTKEISTMEAGGAAGAGSGATAAVAAASPRSDNTEDDDDEPIGEPKDELAMLHEMRSREDSSSIHELSADPEKTIVTDTTTVTE